MALTPTEALGLAQILLADASRALQSPSGLLTRLTLLPENWLLTNTYPSWIAYVTEDKTTAILLSIKAGPGGGIVPANGPTPPKITGIDVDFFKLYQGTNLLANGLIGLPDVFASDLPGFENVELVIDSSLGANSAALSTLGQALITYLGSFPPSGDGDKPRPLDLQFFESAVLGAYVNNPKNVQNDLQSLFSRVEIREAKAGVEQQVLNTKFYTGIVYDNPSEIGPDNNDTVTNFRKKKHFIGVAGDLLSVNGDRTIFWKGRDPELSEKENVKLFGKSKSNVFYDKSTRKLWLNTDGKATDGGFKFGLGLNGGLVASFDAETSGHLTPINVVVNKLIPLNLT